MRTAFVAFALVLCLRPGSPARSADLHGVTGFDEWAEEHPGVREDLARHPSLATDAEYLRRHPSFAEYLHAHPTARFELEDEEVGLKRRKADKDDDEKATRRRQHERSHVFHATQADDD